MERYRRGGLVFDVHDAGPPDGSVVVLLHGFPQRNDSWNAVIDRLAAQGYRCLAPNQRGYSPGARPSRRRDYRMSELVADIGALIDASGARRVHLVGHDWGAAVAWAAAAEMPERLATVSPISVPHPAAFIKSITTSRQGMASWYMYVFQLPRIPEWVLMRRNGAMASGLLCQRCTYGATVTSRCSPKQPTAPLDTLVESTGSRSCPVCRTGYPRNNPTR
jgi:pimeloyl-ACP methyl ester carboxylesterase